VSSAADVLVVGAGIAGCEAAWRCAAAGLNVVVVTTSLDTVYNLASAAAPLAAPHGSLMELVLFNIVPGPRGVRSWDLHRGVKYTLEATPGVHLVQSTVSELLRDAEGAVVGASTWEGVDRRASATALCVGSFLRARLVTGTVTETHGRLSEMAYDDLYQHLVSMGFEFVPISYSGEAHGGSLAYAVDSVALAVQERSVAATGRPSAALRRVPGLYAAGLCVMPAGSAEAADVEVALTYEEAARQGMALADELTA